MFIRETNLFLRKKSKIWTFWEILLFQSYSTANLLPLGVLKTSYIFFEKPISFPQKTHILKVWILLTIPFSFYGKFATVTDFYSYSDFHSKNFSIFFGKETNFWMFWQFLLIHSHSTASLLPLRTFNNFQVLYHKTHLNSWKKHNFKRFESFHHSNRIPRQICYL